MRLRGEVFIDAEGVLVGAGGNESSIAAFISRTKSEPPPLPRIEAIETAHFAGVLPSNFRIGASTLGDIRTEISPDAAICEACAAEIADPSCPKRWARARGVDIQNHIRGRGFSPGLKYKLHIGRKPLWLQGLTCTRHIPIGALGLWLICNLY